MKGLFIGINYVGTENELAGCINDVHAVTELYKKLYGLTNTITLTDNADSSPDKLPTRQNILKYVDWLVNNNKSGEQLFFHYSGHGTYVTDRNGDETDGRDECILPCDFETEGYILDDELREKLVNKIGNSYLFAVMDNCHSGTAFDLNYTYSAIGTVKKISKNNTPISKLNVAMLSGCYDSQTSADTIEMINNRRINCGALSWALCKILNKNSRVSYRELITNVRNLLAKSHYEQIPQLSFNGYPLLYHRAITGDSV